MRMKAEFHSDMGKVNLPCLFAVSSSLHRGEGPPWASLRRCLQHARMMCCPSDDSRLSDAWLFRC